MNFWQRTLRTIRAHWIIAAFILAAPLTLFSAYYNLNGFWQMAVEYTGYGGTGADGALLVDGTVNGPANPLYTDGTRTYLTAAAASGTNTLTVNSEAGFLAGDEVVVIQMLGTGAGNYETRTIAAVAAGSLTLSANLTYGYTNYSAGTQVAQVIRVPHYSSVTINSGGYLTVHSFNGSTGGVMFFRSAGGITVGTGVPVPGTITVNGKGFSGGSDTLPGNGPGGGAFGGGGGTNQSPAATRVAIMGSGGGDGVADAADNTTGFGGGIMIIKTSGTLSVDGAIDLKGANGANNGGGGAAGTGVISAYRITKAASCGTLTASGGSGNGIGQAGGLGRIFILNNENSTNDCPNLSADPSITTLFKYRVQ